MMLILIQSCNDNRPKDVSLMKLILNPKPYYNDEVIISGYLHGNELYISKEASILADPDMKVFINKKELGKQGFNLEAKCGINYIAVHGTVVKTKTNIRISNISYLTVLNKSKNEPEDLTVITQCNFKKPNNSN